MVLNCPTALARPDETARAVIDAIGAAEPSVLRGRNVITAWLAEHSARTARQLFAEACIATYETPDDAVTGFMHRVRYRRNRELLMETPPARPDEFARDAAAVRRVITAALADGKSWLHPAVRCRPRRLRHSARVWSLTRGAGPGLLCHRGHCFFRSRSRSVRPTLLTRVMSVAWRSIWPMPIRYGSRPRQCSSGFARHVPKPAWTGFSFSRWSGGRMTWSFSSGWSGIRSLGRS